MHRISRILLRVGIAVAFICAYLWLFGAQTAFLLEQRYFGWKDPVIWETPSELTDTSVSESPGTRLTYLGCDLEVPWNDLDEQKTKLINGCQTISFRSGKRILLQVFPANERLHFFLAFGQRLDAKDLLKLRSIYGDSTLSSDYAFTSAVLATTPGNLSIFMSRKEAFRAMMLLTIKQFLVPDRSEAIYSIQANHLRGFQFGNPQHEPLQIIDELFSDNERLQFTFPCRGTTSARCISQAEINRIIQSVRSVNQSF